MNLISILAFAATAHLPLAVAAQQLRGREQLDSAVPNPEVFQAAISLDDFKTVDPDKFEWINPDEIQAGETTCGFLKAPLGWEVDAVDVTYPIVKTYVCVTFATQQPASRGNMAVHCGGPSSLSMCNYSILLELDEEALSTYNLIGFDQRGMGRSEPTFVVPECAVQWQDTEGATMDVNFNSEESIRDAAKVYKKVHMDCWNHPAFKLEALQDDGTLSHFHFLEYSGTRQLAEDMERVRRLFGDQKLSVFGISYGTVVMGTYVTVFSDNVNLMVLDGSVDPNSDIVERTIDDVRSIQYRLDYFIASCEFGNKQCGVSDVRTCINDVNAMVDEIGDEYEDWLAPFQGLLEMMGFNTNKGKVMMEVISTLFSAYDEMSVLCDVAKRNDHDSFKDWLFKNLFGDDAFKLDTASLSLPIINKTLADNVTYSFAYNSPSKPTAKIPGSNWPVEGYGTLASYTTVCQDLITAQDMAFGAYDEDRFVKFISGLNEEYSGAGTQLPVRGPMQWYAATYYWPNITPLPPIGDPLLKGIIAGQLYDPWTSYLWTQKMRDQFKSATLLTSRSVNHGLSSAKESLSADRRCFGNVLRYFKNGEIDFEDGHVCSANHIGSSCSIEKILNNDLCDGNINHTSTLAIE